MKVLLIALILLTGCTPSDMTKAKQNYICREHGGVYEYTVGFFKLLCNDGSYFDYNKSITITPEFYPKEKE